MANYCSCKFTPGVLFSQVFTFAYAIAFTWLNLLSGADFAYMQILHPMSKSMHVNGA
jgi:hypothetical protein